VTQSSQESGWDERLPLRRLLRILRSVANERGVALVEFALVAPLLFTVLFGMLDFGKAFNYWIDETHMASEGARLAVVNSAPPWTCPGGSAAASLQQYIQCQADTSELRAGGTSSMPARARVCISFPNGTSNVGDPVTVTVDASYNWMPLIGNGMGGITSSSITGSATERLEGAASNYSSGCY
jgi:hypothetical protein